MGGGKKGARTSGATSRAPVVTTRRELLGPGAEDVDECFAQVLERLVADGDADPPAFGDEILGGHLVHSLDDLDLAKLALLESEHVGPRESSLLRHLPGP